MAGKCKVSNCSRKLCEFEHSDTAVHDNANEEIITCESEVEEEEDTSIEYGENDCHLCTMKFNCIEELSGHFQLNHQEYFQQVSEGAFQLGVKNAEENFSSIF